MADEKGSDDDLRQFVEDACKAQVLLQSEADDGAVLNAERMNRFYQRALCESERFVLIVQKVVGYVKFL
ncbi:hypothetical protein P5673_026382 [Acropora cervicornis]|uniref:Uncharacterized protein n=1 Tax=Acropora cervicornis TaxID=6130 RepID=A0AAD9Q1B0_ACRCE|nr:hypothetical protein P5673_026382 [Acropora cervicornis]